MHGSSFRFGFVFPGVSQSEISMHGSFPEAYSSRSGNPRPKRKR